MALIVGTRQRRVDRRAVIHLREGDVLRQVNARVEVVTHVVIGTHLGLRAVPLRIFLTFDARTPAGGSIVLVRPFRTLTEVALELRHHEEAFNPYRRGDRDAEAVVLTTALGDDLDDPVTSTRAVEGSCRSPLEHGHTFDIFGINIGETVTHIRLWIPEVIVG